MTQLNIIQAETSIQDDRICCVQYYYKVYMTTIFTFIQNAKLPLNEVQVQYKKKIMVDDCYIPYMEEIWSEER